MPLIVKSRRSASSSSRAENHRLRPAAVDIGSIAAKRGNFDLDSLVPRIEDPNNAE